MLMMLVVDSSYSSHIINTEQSGFSIDTCGCNAHICLVERTRSISTKISALSSYGPGKVVTIMMYNRRYQPSYKTLAIYRMFLLNAHDKR